MSELTRQELVDEVLALPAAVVQVFADTSPAVEKSLSTELYDAWLVDGLTIARSSFRAWEATVEYVRGTPRVLDALEPHDIPIWSAYGKELSATSATVASAYFRSSPRFLAEEHIGDLSKWVDAGRRLYHGTWKSGALSARFFEITPGLLSHVSLAHVIDFSSFLEEIAQRSSELAEECLNLAPECFSYVDSETVGSYLELLHLTAEHGWKYAKETQRAAAIALPRLARGERGRFLGFASSMTQDTGKRYLSLLADGSRAMDDLDIYLHHSTLDMFEVLMGLSLEAAVEFLRSAPAVLTRVDATALHRWYTEGVRILAQNDAAGIGFFKLESARGEAIIQELSATVNLEETAPILQMYARGLAGSEIQLRPSPTLAKRSLGWAGEARPTTDGMHIFLPDEISLFETKAENFGWYKVLTTHQAGHMEFGSFDFGADRDAHVFPRTWSPATGLRAPHDEPAVKLAALSDFERFFDIFPDRQLASDIFAAVEGSRVDYLVRFYYVGLRRAYTQVQESAVHGRPAPQQLPLREALVELLIRMTLLDSPGTIPVPDDLHDTVQRVAGVLVSLRSRFATVEDSAEATARIYRMLERVPNLAPQEDMAWNEEDVGELGASAPDPTAEIGPAESATEGGNEFVPGSGTEQDVPYHPPEEVDYRGDFKPELVQTLANLRKGLQQTDETTSSPPLTEEMIRQLL
ncbi:MAG: hypothetical protein O3B84_02265, partial [Chloroflexi bacterium]|nr:hypothetical protein [Chloroflexota bacterium]